MGYAHFILFVNPFDKFMYQRFILTYNNSKIDIFVSLLLPTPSHPIKIHVFLSNLVYILWRDIRCNIVIW